MGVGRKILLLRKEKSWAQNTFSQKVAVFREIISRYERNDVIPSFEVAKKKQMPIAFPLITLLVKVKTHNFARKHKLGC